MKKHLRFNTHIGRDKPYTLGDRPEDCPFCDRGSLVDILDQQGSILFLKNKFPVLEDTFQTVIIETETCDEELSSYSKDHLYQVLRFGISKWLDMSRSGEFASVVFYKNHGPHSGGSLRHPHMQIVGLYQVDYRLNVHPDQFEGIVIDANDGIQFNVSTLPRMGFTELNVVLRDLDQVERMADYLQMAAHYTLHGFNKFCSSYNLFFYELSDGIAAKLIPRFVVGPLFVGFSIPQVSNRVEEIAEALRRDYLGLRH